MPHFGWNQQIDEDSSIGVLLGGNGGMNSDYNSDIWRDFNNGSNIASAPSGVDLAQLFVGFPYARKRNASHSVGIMPIVAAQRLEATGLEPLQGFSVHPAKVSNNGHDYSFGYRLRVGWLGEVGQSGQCLIAAPRPVLAPSLR